MPRSRLEMLVEPNLRPPPTGPSQAPSRTRTLLLVAGLLLTAGCKGCTGGSGKALTEGAAEEVVDKEPVQASRRATRGAARDRGGLAEFRTLGMRIPEAPEAERPLADSVGAARAEVETGTRESALAAKARLEARVAEQPDDADAHYWLGRAHIASEEPRMSQDAFAAAIEHAPDFVAPYRWSAYAAYERKSCGDAVALLDKAVELDADNPDVYVDRAVCLRQARQWDAVLEDVVKLCDMDEPGFCDLIPQVERILDRMAARQAGRKQVGGAKATQRKRVGKLGKLRSPGGPGALGTLGPAVRGKARSAARGGEPEADETQTDE